MPLATKDAALITAQLKNIETQQYNENIAELKALTGTLGWNITQEFHQTLLKANSHTFIGKGKVDEIKKSIQNEAVSQVFVGNDISPSQAHNLEKTLEVPIADRSYIVLQIFQQHAATYQAKTQVELALLQYQLPRLTGLWTHLDREKGGSNVSKGMGERQINVDRNLLRSRISLLNKRLKLIEKQHQTEIKNRKSTFQVCIAGYTNAGKTSLMNNLTEAKLIAADKLFTSLDTNTKKLHSKLKPTILVSDTVGFISDLPAELRKSFRTTLAALTEADLILHICDVASNNWELKMKAAQDIILDISDNRIPIMLIFNKVDLLDEDTYNYLRKSFPDALLISNKRPEDTNKVVTAIEKFLQKDFLSLNIQSQYYDKKLVKFLWNQCLINNLQYLNEGLQAEIALHKIYFKQLQKYFPHAKYQVLT